MHYGIWKDYQSTSRAHARVLHNLIVLWLTVQVECPAVTPEVVLKASGHVDRFTDLMVTDVVTGDCHRADHLLEAALQALLDGKPKPLDAQEKQVPFL